MSRYQKKHSPTHHPDHHPIFISFFHLPRSIASPCSNYVLGNLFAQPLSMSFLVYDTSWSGALHLIFHTFLHPCNQCLLFAAHAHTIANCFPVLSILYHLLLVFLSTPWKVFYLNITHTSDHSHLCSLKCHLIFFPDRPGLTSVQNTTLHTTAIQPPSPNQ